MKTVELDGSLWTTCDDFYEAFLPAIGAPEWHGRNRDALWDSIAHGGINEIEAPFTVHIRGLSDTELKAFLHTIECLFEEARAGGIDVHFIVE